MPYEILEHTADIRIKVSGKNLEELFTSALKAMTEIMQPDIKEKPIKIRKIEVSAPDKTALLIDFLSDILTTANIHKEVYPEVKFEKISDTSLIAEIKGVVIEAFHEDIKAVTFHEADIQKNKEEQFETNIVFDI